MHVGVQNLMLGIRKRQWVWGLSQKMEDNSFQKKREINAIHEDDE